MQKRIPNTLLVIAILLIGLGGLLAVKLTPPKPVELQSGFLFPNAFGLAPFELVDQHQQAFTNANLTDQWSLFFIGFTYCPDICPTTLNKLAAAYSELKKVAPIQVVFLSVDPKRDTPDKLLSYVNFFNPEFKAVTGEQTQIFPLTRSLGLTYAMVGEGENYQVDHSAGYVLVSPQGTRVAVFKPTAELGQAPQVLNEALISDFAKIVSSYKPQ
ncbi:MAG: SCO family protein [Shewanella sp.]|uniref:SCO family protein n=1 Tax=Shewanella cutis TaxID=2766780 RepID=A0ABS9QZ70_9GAMM|nr:SCO family protein [Shewanella sp. PS-2]MCG9965637.1 SCO family protein [Shewanella sp. PS-2]